MKKLLLPALAIVALASCNNEEMPDFKSNEPVEIKLNAGVVQTKAAIESDASGILTNELSGIQFVRVDGATPDWTSPTAATFTGTIGTDGSISGFTQYYPSDGTDANIIGYYPAATAVAGGKLSMKIDGTNDVIYAGAVKGNKTTPIADALQFGHKLSQFKFVVKIDGTSVTSEVSGVTVTINNANTTFDMAIADGGLSNFGTPVSTIKAVNNATTSLTPSGAIMLQPKLTELSVNIVADGFTQKDLTIKPKTPDTEFAAGSAYTITIVLGKKSIEATAKMTQWVNGTNPDDVNFQ